MITGFIIAGFITAAFNAATWSSKRGINFVLKLLFIAIAAWGAVVVAKVTMP